MGSAWPAQDRPKNKAKFCGISCPTPVPPSVFIVEKCVCWCRAMLINTTHDGDNQKIGKQNFAGTGRTPDALQGNGVWRAAEGKGAARTALQAICAGSCT